jgi:hypothetical protein
MGHVNLLVTFRVSGDAQFQVKGAASVKVDGRGGLILYGPDGDVEETIEVGRLQSFQIHSLAQRQVSLAA